MKRIYVAPYAHFDMLKLSLKHRCKQDLGVEIEWHITEHPQTLENALETLDSLEAIPDLCMVDTHFGSTNDPKEGDYTFVKVINQIAERCPNTPILVFTNIEGSKRCEYLETLNANIIGPTPLNENGYEMMKDLLK